MATPWEKADLDKETYLPYLQEMEEADAQEFLEELGLPADVREAILYAVQNYNEEEEQKAEEARPAPLTKAPVWTPEDTLPVREVVRPTTPTIPTLPRPAPAPPPAPAKPKEPKKRSKGVTVSGNSLGQWLAAEKAPENPHEAGGEALATIGSWQLVDDHGGPDFVCSICLDMSRDTVILECRAHFCCRVCWTQMVSVARNKSIEADILAVTTGTSSEEKHAQCPQCKKAISIRTTDISEIPMLKTKYDNLTIRCEDEKNCKWQGRMIDYDEHMKKHEKDKGDEWVNWKAERQARNRERRRNNKYNSYSNSYSNYYGGKGKGRKDRDRDNPSWKNKEWY